MTEPEEEPKKIVPVGRGGGELVTFIPQNLEEVKRIAHWAAIGGMAPKSLVEGRDLEGAVAACAIAIMAGAELGLTPMMALRSYAVINGRPSLWGDGLIAVVMKSPVYKPGSLKRGGDAKMGWAEAERVDGTKWREEFTWAQAVTAGLTGKDLYKKYPDVMLQRRAISKLMNFLFADVLGGMVSADEAYEDGGMIDITPNTPPSPPPADGAPTPTTTDPAEVLKNLAYWLDSVSTDDGVETTWAELDIEGTLTGTYLDAAEDMRTAALTRIKNWRAKDDNKENGNAEA